MKNTKNTTAIILILVCTVFATAGGVYIWWQQRFQHQTSAAQQQLSDVQKQLAESEALRMKAENDKLELERKSCKESRGTWENNICVASQYSIHLISPNGGEVLCAGKPFDIKWESKGLKVINIFMLKSGSNLPFYRIGLEGFPSNFNEEGKDGYGVYRWTVGDQNGYTPPSYEEGYTYQVMVMGTPPGSPTPQYEDVSDNVFSIQHCQG